MDKKKLLFINGHLNAGGVERSLVDVLRHLDYGKYEVDLLLLEGYGDYLPEIPSDVNVLMYPLNEASGPLLPTLLRNLFHGRFFLFFYRLLMLGSRCMGNRIMRYARLLFSNGNTEYYAVIGYRPGGPTIMAAYTFRACRRVAWWHHGEINVHGEHKNKLQDAYFCMDIVVVVSDSCAKMLKVAFPLIASKVVVIPNMLCIEEIRQKALAEKVSLLSSTFNIVSVGRMSPEKNMAFCVDVAKRLKTTGFNFHWYVVGDGEEMEQIRDKIEAAQLSSCMTLAGKLSNPYPYIQSSDLLFHPSLVESQGITVLEAMALGTLVVVVESAGPKEFIRNGENGVLIVPDVEAAISAVIGGAADVYKRECLVEEALRTTNTYVPEKIIRQIGQLLFEECPTLD